MRTPRLSSLAALAPLFFLVPACSAAPPSEAPPMLDQVVAVGVAAQSSATGIYIGGGTAGGSPFVVPPTWTGSHCANGMCFVFIAGMQVAQCMYGAYLPGTSIACDVANLTKYAIPAMRSWLAVNAVAQPVLPAVSTGGTAASTGTILAGSFAVAVLGTIAIDYAVHGNFFWTAVNEAGGWGQVLGTAPSNAAAPSFASPWAASTLVLSRPGAGAPWEAYDGCESQDCNCDITSRVTPRSTWRVRFT